MMKRHLEDLLDNALEMYDKEVLKNIQLKKQYEIMKMNAEYLIEKNDELNKKNKEQDEEIEKLNNIINELEKWCNEEMYADDQLYEKVLNKLQELKGVDKE